MASVTRSGRHKVEREVRGNSDRRATNFTYTPSLRLSTKTLPTGVTLFYAYTPLGQLQTVCSSDESINHTRVYNLLGYLTEASDLKNSLTILREVDPFGNVLKETFPLGFSVTTAYDELNRPTKVTFGDKETLLYTALPLDHASSD